MPPIGVERVSKLTQMESGDYAILINGDVFGVINAHPKAEFKCGEHVYKAGTYLMNHKGKKYKVEVKDISPDITFYDLERVEREYREDRRIFKRPVDRLELDERIKSAKARNEKAMQEILGRVVVTEEAN